MYTVQIGLVVYSTTKKLTVKHKIPWP